LSDVTPSCPAKTCKKPDAPQEEMASAPLASAGVTASWIGQAHRCTHCGCVYTMEADKKSIRGYFDNPVLGDGWKMIFL
jgi:hypothetical protein